MKILLISGRADISGGPIHVRDLAAALKRQGHEIFIASPSEGKLVTDFDQLSSARLDIGQQTFSLAAFWNLKQFILRHRIDVLHSHGRSAGLLARLAGLAAKVPCVHTFHGMHSPPGLGGWARLWLERFLIPWTSALIFVSQDEIQKGVRRKVYHPDRSHVVMNGIDLARFTPRQRSFPSQHPLIGGVIARQDPVKGLDLLAHAAKLRPPNASVEWKIAGVKDLKEIPANVTPAGRVDTRAFFETIDFMASFAREEGLPLSILEAMACGVPLVLSAIEDHRYFFENGVAIPFQAEVPAALYAAIQHLLIEREKTEQRIAQGIRLAHQMHSTDAMAAAVVAIYERVLAS